MSYDPLYLAGVQFFNRRDFFEAHEVWEDLWAATSGPERRFFQALIQAAVALFHLGNGNLRGAARLYHSSRDYMKPFGPSYQGLNVVGFWEAMGSCFEGLLEPASPQAAAVLPDEDRLPTIVLEPPPDVWPNPESFLREEDKP